MFERFTESARRVVGRAGQEAAELRHGYVGTEHLLLAILAEPDDPAAAVLVDAGLDHETARRAVRRLLGEGGDAQALAAIGVDLEAVREAVESVFGEGALDAAPEGAESRRRGWLRSGAKERRSPFTARARKVLELSLRESLRLKSGHIAVGHLLLGVLREGEGLGAKVIAGHGLDAQAVRRAVEATLG
ncbi:Clp protease N-terminal domain-containing protein [Streptomyces sp. CB01881]|uniref:Clp protease N-terminal domain-containing protein n=1 Tax=Streptomyces sp. CB01881 TaxID=2078691 RepID=UPI000CDC532A|nr:Clp protease N-terminal domain-containing protein [Streptomyces sp. CB01881]AUY49605.1 Clp protease [Streptomyces sp. CB01881]TYC73000.1 Clp protease [Streptomyces sp. CB01881]